MIVWVLWQNTDILAMLSNLTNHYNDVTWASWCLKSPEPQLFVHHFVQVNIKESTIGRTAGTLWGWSVVSLHKGPAMRKDFARYDVNMRYGCDVWCTGGFPSQRASNAENAFIRWRHHAAIAPTGASGMKIGVVWIKFDWGLFPGFKLTLSLRWRHNGCDSVSNHQPRHCLLNRLFRRRSKKTSKLRVTGLCAVNSLGTGEFPAQMASYAENVSIWWRHHG